MKECATGLGISVNEYILKMLDGKEAGLNASHSVANSQQGHDEPYSDPAFEEFADSMTEPKNPCPDCGAELGWNDKRKIYECKCGFIKKGRK